jgi:hypothetical protein
MAKLGQIIRFHGYLLDQNRQQLEVISQKLDHISHRLDRDIICVNAFQSVAREVTKRRQHLLASMEAQDDQEDEIEE